MPGESFYIFMFSYFFVLQKMKHNHQLFKKSENYIAKQAPFYYIFSPMKISETIEAHMSVAVAAISQRNQATLPGHLIFIPVQNVFNCSAKAFGFCLSFYSEKCYA